MKPLFVIMAIALVIVLLFIFKRPTALIRGFTDGMLVSPARPDIAVKASPAFRPTDAARFEVLMPVRHSSGDRVTAIGYYALWEDTSTLARLSAVFAELDGPYFWTPEQDSPAGTIRTRKSNISSFRGTATTLIRASAADPWRDAGEASPWNNRLLIRRYAYPAYFLRFNVIIEYREPLPTGEIPIEDDPAALAQFEKRADTAFTILRKEDAVLPRPEKRLPYPPEHVKRQGFADYLGEVRMEARS